MSNTVLTNPGGSIKVYGGSGAALGAAAGIAIACPAGKRWKLLNFISDTTASATVGNRNMLVRISATSAATDWVGTLSGNVTAAQICGYDIGFGAPINTPATAVRRTQALTANTNVQVRESCSLNEVDQLGYVNIRDTANIDVADTVTYRLTVIEYDR